MVTEMRGEKMTMFDEAKAIAAMLDMRKMTQSEIAKRLGSSQAYVANKLRLLKLGEAVRRRIIELGLSERHARALLRIKDEPLQLATAEKIGAMHLSVQASEALIDAELLAEAPKSIRAAGRSGGLARFDDVLKEALLSLRALGIEVDVRTSNFGKTRYITMVIEE